MRARATRVGAEVPADFSGVVTAAFQRSCLVALASPAGDVRLVVLQADDLPMTPVSVAIAGLHPPAEGERVAAIQLDLAEAARFEGGLGAPEPPPAPTALRDLVPSPRPTAARDPFGRALVERLAALGVAVAGGDPWRAGRAAERLVGLGPGLTPAGDDALCGFLLGRELLGSRSRADAAVAGIATHAWGRTTDVSAQFLALAARGRYGEALLAVAEALRRRDGRELRRATGRCLDQGATSGADALLGLSAALDTDDPGRVRLRA